MRAVTVKFIFVVFIVGMLTACVDSPWNSPYSTEQTDTTIFYSSFSERPKHFDPVRSYSANEWAFISQIYEPPLQYHFLKRPYELDLLTATKMPETQLFDKNNQRLPADAAIEDIAFSEYHINIKPGILYQPHPAFAKTPDNGYRYWPLGAGSLEDKYEISHFTETDTRELLAEDYLYQIKRLAFLKNHSPIAGLMGEHIVGFSEFSETLAEAHKKAKTKAKSEKDPVWLDLREFEMPGLKVIDKYTYSIRLKNTYPQFRYWLAMNFFAPMPWEVERFFQQPGMDARNLNLNWYPVGTGPFMLTENNPNLRMVLERNPNFHGELYPSEGTGLDKNSALLKDAGQTMPFVDRVVYSLEKEAIPRWNKFLQGYYDNSGISSDSFDQAVQFASSGETQLTPEMKKRGIALSTAVETSIYYTGFNMLDPVVGGNTQRARLLRQAISIAIDMEEYISIFRNGRGEAAQGLLPPGIFGHRGGEAGVNPYVYEYVGDTNKRLPIARAKQLMVQAGYPEGRDPKSGAPLILYYDTSATGPGSKATLDWYRKQFNKIGIQLVIRSSDYNRFQGKMLKGTAQIFSWGWNADYPDPENFFFLLYGPNGKVKHKGENASNYHSKEFDELFDQMKNMPDGTERQVVIDQMLEIMRKDAPWVWGFYPKGFSLHHAWYKNAKPHLMANNTLKYKRIDPVARSQARQQWNQPVIWPLVLTLIILLLGVVPAVIAFQRRERSLAR